MAVTQQEKLVNPGDVILEKVEIESITGELFDISEMFVEINIYEDLFNNGLSGNVVVADSRNMFNMLPIIGQEVFRIKFKTPVIDPDDIRELTFMIYKVSQRVIQNDQTQVYSLHFVSMGTIRNSLIKISKTLGIGGVGGQTIGDMVTYIASESMEGGGLESSVGMLTATQGAYQFVIPNWTPYKTINWLAKRANDKTYGNKNFVFYETISIGGNGEQQGDNGMEYHFMPIGGLIAATPRHESEYYFGFVRRTEKATGRELFADIKSQFYTVNDYEILDSLDTLAAIRGGMFASKLVSYDMRTKKTITTTFNYYDEFFGEGGTKNNNFLPGKGGGKFPLTVDKDNPGGFRYHQEPDSYVRYYDTHEKYHNEGLEQHPEEYLLWRQSQMQQLKFQRLRCEVPGNSYLRAGDVFNLTLPSLESQGPEFKEDKFLSGKYIITSLRHKIQRSGYFSIMEMVKDTFYTAIPETAKDAQ